MKIAIIGGGMVGQTLGAGFAKAGHQVTLGIRNPSPEELARDRNGAKPLAHWQADTGVTVTNLATAAAAGEVVVNATQGAASLAALTAAGAANLAGKVLVDVANPLDFSAGMPPFLGAPYAGPASLGEAIQTTFPEARVVKAFNTVTHQVMVNPALIPGDHDFFLAGNDAEAKATVRTLAEGFGWRHFNDMGDIVGARATEAILPLWIRLYMTGGSPLVNIHVLRA